MTKRTSRLPINAKIRLTLAGIIGLCVVVWLILMDLGRYAPLVGWDAVAIAYMVMALASVLPCNGEQTRTHALRENPGRAAADAILLATSIASLAGVGVLILLASRAEGITKAADIALGLFSVIASWGLVHTLFLLRYARLYYGDPEGGIDFNQKSPPSYMDFAYMAFTVGMTFQVSDTQIQTKRIRGLVLRHALLSYLFGTVIIATTINTLASLGK